MAVKFIENHSGGTLGCWEISESETDLMNLLQASPAGLAGFDLIRNEKRRMEWLATRLLLAQMTGPATTVTYEPSGKPLLNGASGTISISHSNGYVVIFHHPIRQPGIDIERLNREVSSLAGRFLSSSEIKDCTKNGILSNEEVMLRWCAKEAVFKMLPDREIDFSSEISCQAKPFSRTGGTITAAFCRNGSIPGISMHYRVLDDMLLVWGDC